MNKIDFNSSKMNLEITKELIPTGSYNPHEYFNSLKEKIRTDVTDLLGWYGYFEQIKNIDSKNKLEDVLNKQSSDSTFINIIELSLGKFNTFSDLIEVFFLLEKLDGIKDLFLRIFYLNEKNKLSGKSIYSEDFSRIPKNINFKEETIDQENNVEYPKCDETFTCFDELSGIGIVYGYNNKTDNNDEINKGMKTFVGSFLNRILSKKDKDNITLSSIIDGGVNLPNRRFFIDYLIPYLKGKNFTMGIIDLDFFKKINDVYSHLGGDQVLLFAANVFLEALKEYNGFPIRIGGEEFLLTIPGSSDINDMIKVLHNIKNKFLENRLILTNGDALTITSSAGIGVFNSEKFDINDNRDIFKFWDLLDKALYLSKIDRNSYTILDQDKFDKIDFSGGRNTGSNNGSVNFISTLTSDQIKALIFIRKSEILKLLEQGKEEIILRRGVFFEEGLVELLKDFNITNEQYIKVLKENEHLISNPGRLNQVDISKYLIIS